MEDNKGQVIVTGLDLQDITKFISDKNKRYLAATLQDIEDELGSEHPAFVAIRKSVLDGFNNYTRSLISFLFIDIEDEFYDGPRG